MKEQGRPYLKAAVYVVLSTLGGLLFLSGYQLIAVRGTFARSMPAAGAGGSAVLVDTPRGRVAGRVYLIKTAMPGAPLVVLLHGDAPFVNPRYQYGVASQLAEAVPGVRVVALLRPGYSDPYGGRSDGNRGFATGQNYTREVIDQLAAAIQNLQLRWGASTALIVGHSGGASLAADIAALYPELTSHVFLVGCPCDVPAFRKHMAALQRDPLWLIPSHSISPMTTLDQIPKRTEVTVISGSSDPIALPEYSESYVANAQRLGIPASITILSGRGHEIFEDPAVIRAVVAAVEGTQAGANNIGANVRHTFQLEFSQRI